MVNNEGRPYDKTRPSYDVASDGTLQLNFHEYDGQGIFFTNHVTIYAVADNGREIEILNRQDWFD